MKTRIILLMIFLPSIMIAQSTGIKWTEGMSWQQILEKAKLENKYIFLDCYTTWCGPCRKMDEVVYSTNSVGDYFNEHFISVKVQMDKTKNDNESIKQWYDDAAGIGKKYRIEGYPCFLFFSPQGSIIHKEMGYKDPPAFVTIAQIATKPGTVYNDPYAEYDQLVIDYKNGIKHYDKMVGMIKVADKFGETKLAQQLLDEHTNYVAGLPKKQRYTKDALQLWSGYVLNSSGKRFRFFYNDGDLIDKVMNIKGFAASIVDKTILYEIIHPFYKEQPGGEIMLEDAGMMLMFIDPATGLPTNVEKKGTDYREADWNELYRIIRRKYNTACAKRNMLEAKLEWYKRHDNWRAFTSSYIEKLKMNNGDDNINNIAFDIFLHVTDKALLNKLIPWMEKVVKAYPLKDYAGAAEIDTYANLLYKVGRLEDAIAWEEKAARLAGSNSAPYLKLVEQMKKGMPTYGAIWE